MALVSTVQLTKISTETVSPAFADTSDMVNSTGYVSSPPQEINRNARVTAVNKNIIFFFILTTKPFFDFCAVGKKLTYDSVRFFQTFTSQQAAPSFYHISDGISMFFTKFIK